MKITPIITTAALALTLTACASHATTTSRPPAPTHSATPTPLSGPEGYLAAIRHAGLGNKDLSGQPQLLIHVGRIVCDGLSTSLDYGDSVSAVLAGTHGVTAHQAAVLVGASIRDLCPEHSDLLPAGAP